MKKHFDGLTLNPQSINSQNQLSFVAANNLLILACETSIFSAFLSYLKDKSLLLLNLSISEYIDQIPQPSGCLNNTVIFKQIHQNIRPYPRCKRIDIYQWWREYYCILGRIRAKRGIGEQTNITHKIFETNSSFYMK